LILNGKTCLFEKLTATKPSAWVGGQNENAEQAKAVFLTETAAIAFIRDFHTKGGDLSSTGPFSYGMVLSVSGISLFRQ
jgi:hypothetical protein